ncbi:methylated-DNA--[protein]-cysteine S-methyltransferase [Defluviimonas sp. WL0002]|uniref:Methylated-DNA--[protein]-cysteine S-methyltransferase n=1 Tax=Albidovulum marisflavi TaxID=2984159 RepID=A0ABT2Z9X5_9RHOB|nr:methylated-DNA--[protein]-cysteine S-methyltransferase [Defluviimonas sp. WL0002]MCV2867938.1 methylated-DNA--[protein]-cysteine S-methyltransferase [Defluviimonas sp. WL0002]
MTSQAAFDGPLGRLVLTETGGAITRLEWSGAEVADSGSPLLDEACRQLGEYFARRQQEFELPLAYAQGLTGAVMRAMCAIPFGQTRTYGDLAKDLGASAQAIGQACGANPIPVVVPCHRILGATGLGGFSAPGGVETKVALLKHEGAASLLI